VARRRRPSLFAPSALIFSNAMRKGLFGDSRLWKAVGIVILARRGLKKVMGGEPRTLAVERIKPGETVILRGVRSRNVPAS
jgi:hypothetical protein